jgi:hypothetical protein
VEIHVRDLPGRRCGTDSGLDAERDNVHVGIQERREPAQLVPGDAERAMFAAEVTIVSLADGIDFQGPAVQGRRGERFVYLTWGSIHPDGAFTMFRRAKLMLNAINPNIVAAANRPGYVLEAQLGLTDARGGPLCARVVPPLIAWRAHRRS